jgi:hypothetical protein
MKKLALGIALGLLLLSYAWAQQPQTQAAPDYAANARYVQGVGMGYAPFCTHSSGPPGKCPGTDRVIHYAAGTVDCGGTIREDAASTYTVPNNPTEYLYQDPAASCAFADQTSSDLTGKLPLYKVTIAGGVITAIDDLRGIPHVSNFQVSGNTRVLVSFSGSATASRCLHTDASGNAVVAASDCASGSSLSQVVANDTSTGTTANRIAKDNGSGKAIIATTSDVVNVPFYGIVTTGAGTSGDATIAYAGQVSCDFDGSTTAGDAVRASISTNGKCHDKGTSGFDRWDSQFDLGTVVSTNSGAGTYLVNIGQVGQNAFNSQGYMVPLMKNGMQSLTPSALSQTNAGMNNSTGFVNVENGVGLRFYGSSGSNPAYIQNDGTNLIFHSNSSQSQFQFTNGAVFYANKSDGGTGTWDISAKEGPIHNFTMTANLTTVNFNNFNAGTPLWLLLCQNGTGGFTVTWPAAVKGTIGTMPAGANACLFQGFLYYDSTHIWALASGTY